MVAHYVSQAALTSLCWVVVHDSDRLLVWAAVQAAPGGVAQGEVAHDDPPALVPGFLTDGEELGAWVAAGKGLQQGGCRGSNVWCERRLGNMLGWLVRRAGRVQELCRLMGMSDS